MPGLSRYIKILRLFDEQHGAWTIAEMASALGLPASTVYRTVREMVSCDFLETAQEAHYRLGYCFVEYDRLARLTDPLYEAGAPLLREIVQQARSPCVAVLARLHNDTVMCIADARSAGASINTSYERGRPRPLTQGATSKVILAQLPTRRLTRLLASDTGDALRRELATIRKQGFSITRGEVDQGLIGIAAPVSGQALIGSLSLIVNASGDAALERRLAMLVVSTASLLTEHLSAPAPALESVAAPRTALVSRF